MQTALRSAFPLDARRLAVLAALVLAMIQARTVVLYTLKTHVQLPGSLEVRYQRLLRFVQFQVPDGLFIRFALRCLPEGPLDLILDRTNWKLGQHDVNILLLSAVWNGFSLPLMWSLLPHGGSSSQAMREALMERFFAACPGHTFSGLLADREFIGKDWFGFLTRHRLDPCIRLPATATVGTGGLPVWACFKKLRPGEVRMWYRPLMVYGVALRVSATKNAAGETLYLAHRGRATTNLRRYAQRWQTENLHSALKTRGFNLEDTGLTRAERVSTLLTAVSVTFIWACLTVNSWPLRRPYSAKNTDTARCPSSGSVSITSKTCYSIPLQPPGGPCPRSYRVLRGSQTNAPSSSALDDPAARRYLRTTLLDAEPGTSGYGAHLPPLWCRTC